MITASIVTYNNNPEDVSRVLHCTSDSLVEKIYVIDNSPVDLFRSYGEFFPKVEYIWGQGNVGYGSAHNIGIERAVQAGAVYHIVINPDIYFDKDVIEKIAGYLDGHPEVGQVMPKVFYPNGELQYLCKLLPTPMDLLCRRFIPYKKYIEKRNNRYELRFTDYDSIMEVPSLSGCFMFLRTDVLKEIGGFDERFFMYAEDIDLCRRIGKVSRTIYYPLVSIYHEYEKGSYKNRKLFKYHICSVIKYFNKWGWLFDSERKERNNRILKQYNK